MATSVDTVAVVREKMYKNKIYCIMRLKHGEIDFSFSTLLHSIHL